MCTNSRLVRNPKYIPNEKNGGIVPPVKDQRVLAVPIKCGECMECMKQKKRDWTIRLKEELKTNKQCYMVVLTFSNESITELYNDKAISNLKGYNLDNAAATLAIRRFTERWRKKYGVTIRHWLVTELGHNGTENIHLHGILWSKDKEEIRNKWKYGFVYIGHYVNERTINYNTKYVMKQDLKHKAYTPIVLTSNAMGKKYTDKPDAKLNKYIPNKTKETYTDSRGYTTNLPTYYKNKIYTDEEKEKLWIEKLDKQVRYIHGRKVDISTERGIELYYKMLKEAQIENRQKGYGNGHRKWAMAQYEIERRTLLQEKRKEGAQAQNGHASKDEALPQTPSYVSSPDGQGYINQESNITGLLHHMAKEKDK